MLMRTFCSLCQFRRSEEGLRLDGVGLWYHTLCLDRVGKRKREENEEEMNICLTLYLPHSLLG